MLSRVAENLYWMARYIERAENTARLVGVNANLLLDLPKGIAPGWEPLIAITGSEAQYRGRYADASERNVLRFLIADLENPGSILFSLRAARENCRTIRDIVPREAWEQLNELYLYAREEINAGLTKKGRHAYLKQVIQSVQMLTGLMVGTMNHDAGYQFMRVGRNLERADMTTRIIDVRSASLLDEASLELRPLENIQWVSVLKSLTGYQMYRQSMQVSVRQADVRRFLFRHGEFPRSVMHTMGATAEGLEALPVKADAPLRVVARVRRTLLDTDVGDMGPEALHDFIDELQRDFMEIHAEVDRAYFHVGLEQTQVQTATG